MLYLVVAALAGGMFTFCSYWVYRYVDLDHDPGETEGSI